MTKTSTPENLQANLAKSSELNSDAGILQKASEDATEVINKFKMQESKHSGPSKKSLSLIMQFAAAFESFNSKIDRISVIGN